jgi:hypothetical protein
MNLEKSTGLSTPWHQRSYEHLLRDTLPELLTARLPLVGYEIETAPRDVAAIRDAGTREKPGSVGTYSCRVRVSLAGGKGDVSVVYEPIPCPDGDGLFRLGDAFRLVVPIAGGEALELAEIRCVGEQLYEYIERRLGEAPPELTWDEGLMRSWLPLDRWINEFLEEHAQSLDVTNALAARVHARRLLIPDRTEPFAAGELGRVCPFETPEGPNLGRIRSIAVGAEIRDGRLAIIDDRPESALGLSARLIPFLEHDDPNRLLMGCNMMRQWEPFDEPEPALVQTGYEFDAPGFWCGVNLLTAFVSWGTDTFEDGIVLSESAARRFRREAPIEPGDKISNRHGQKGVVSRIIPDDQMPHLADGSPVELIVSYLGCQARMNFGQIREAIMGRIARAEGRVAIVPPFQAPDETSLRERLRLAGLPESGMETLTDGRGGPPLARPSTVGWIYWGRTVHQARLKLVVTIADPPRPDSPRMDDAADSRAAQTTTSACGPRFVGQRWGELEIAALREAGAFENIRDGCTTRSAASPDVATLSARLTRGPLEQAGPPRPGFAEIQRRLDAVGIRTDLTDSRLSFRCEEPREVALELARPVLHPWLRTEMTKIGHLEDQPGWTQVVECNERARRMGEGKAPAGLDRTVQAQLEQAVGELVESAIAPEQIRFGELCVFTGRAVAAPGGPQLRLDQVGLPAEIAWELFAPLLRRTIKEEAIRARSAEATELLDTWMSRSWVIVNRAPTLWATCMTAFHPVREPSLVIRLHPLVARTLNADFDGDQLAVTLPVTESAQREAGEKLSVAGHLRRDPGLLAQFCPPHESLWGLAELGREQPGQQEIEAILGTTLSTPEGCITQNNLAAALQEVMLREGVESMMERLDQLARLGFRMAHRSGASMSPFFGSPIDRTGRPTGDQPDAWRRHADEIEIRISAWRDYDHPEVGPQILAVRSGARGSIRQLCLHLAPRVDVPGAQGGCLVVRHGYVEGLASGELFACAALARKGLAGLAVSFAEMGAERLRVLAPRSFHVLARAMHSAQPGRVLAHAAANREVDPLTDVTSRLFVGLGPLGPANGSAEVAAAPVR